MANIVNATAVKFCNEKARVLADLIEKTRRTAEQFALDIVVEFENLTGGNSGGDLIVDGSATDGRQPITKDSIAALKFVAEQLVVSLTTDDRADLVAGVSVNGQPSY